MCALCMYSTFGHHPHSLGYLCAKFCFFCSLHCWAIPWRKLCTQSLTHPAYLIPREPLSLQNITMCNLKQSFNSIMTVQNTANVWFPILWEVISIFSNNIGKQKLKLMNHCNHVRILYCFRHTNSRLSKIVFNAPDEGYSVRITVHLLWNPKRTNHLFDRCSLNYSIWDVIMTRRKCILIRVPYWSHCKHCNPIISQTTTL